jgi:outer membrane protein assembly factor BamB
MRRNKSKKRYIACLISTFLILLAGCSTLSGVGKDNTAPPAPLVDFKQECRLNTVWQSHVGSGAGRAHPRFETAVSQGVAYTVEAAGNVTATNTNNGRTLWSVNTNTSPSSGPAVYAGYLVFGTSSEVAVLSSRNGRTLWRAPVSTELLAPPVIAGRTVLTKAVDGEVSAFDLMTGQLRWTFKHKTPLVILQSDSSPVVFRNRVYIGFGDGQLVALQLQTGQLLWQKMIAVPRGIGDPDSLVGIVADPMISGSLIYLAAYQGKLAAVSLETGRLVWERSLSTYDNFDMQGALIVVADDQGFVWGINRFNGKVLWQQTAFRNRQLTAPLIRGQEVLIGDAVGCLHVLATQNGRLIARHLIDGSGVFVQPVAATGGVLARAESGLLVKVNCPPMNREWCGH